MANVNLTPAEPASQPPKVSLGRLLLRLFLLLIILLGLLLLAAGRTDWVQAWSFSLAFVLFLLSYGVWTLYHDPNQLVERSKMEKNIKSWDKTIMSIYSVLLFILLILAGLDGGRFHWAPAPPLLQIIGWFALLFAGGIIFWTTSVNTFLSRYMRIQDDRSQQTVTRGPYRWIRHPMYLGVITLMLGIPLVLGSLWSLLPGVLIGILFIIRTALEDKALQAELPGYREYAQKVRYRLIPGIW
jgi:protein-S-isoprenylcysteine O-methyltransferase Ste14